MNHSWQTVLERAQEMGFEYTGILDAREALHIYAPWRISAPASLQARLSTDPTAQMPTARSILMLGMPFSLYRRYPAGCAHVSGYYMVSQQSYTAAHALAAQLKGEVSSHLPLKPLAQAAGLGAYGRASLIVHDGPHMALQAILLEKDARDAPAPLAATPLAKDDTACERACPTGAISDGHVDVTHCLRAFMLEAKPVPPAYRAAMRLRLLGCDNCLRSYPACTYTEPPKEYERLFSINALLDPAALSQNRRDIAAMIGANYARPARLMAQAAIVAGNTGDTRYLPAILSLAQSEQPVLREHALWASEKLQANNA